MARRVPSLVPSQGQRGIVCCSPKFAQPAQTQDNLARGYHLPLGLDEEAVKTVSTWRFKPAMRQGVSVPVRVQVEVSFRLF
jgi:hypothetical protein